MEARERADLLQRMMHLISELGFPATISVACSGESK